MPVLLLALTFHEFAHGWVAYRFGDDTAYQAGRLTLNPLAHLDPVGTLMIFLVHFGWAKPVPINPARMRNPKKHALYVALAGPASNLILAWILAILLRISLSSLSSGLLMEGMSHYTKLWLGFLILGIEINIALAFFNLLPIYPLDGSRVVSGLLPLQQAYAFSRLEPYGFMILIGLILIDHSLNIPVFRLLIWYPVQVFGGLFTGLPWWTLKAMLLHILNF